ncbi:putative NIF3-like protein 1 [Legionella londiniensis]|uniref:GTP cyclohydrolase 1 type 2 homolog n=2 Tax=Legionella londiniensis TaxID=45068 RepID=A0A0W0VKU8_9GAMM|nr:putative NIF3-like protein 1 [Legionella londiniensis]STX92815.1 putative NIF3-like protein 1 [Legionella londiniensis]
MQRDQLASYLHEFLRCAEYSDYAPNGMQVEGRETIKTICTAVTASHSAVLEAIKKGADALLVHHGYFWRGEEACITGIKKKRIGELIRHDLSLFAYHLPLDCHPELGNNVSLARMLAIESPKMHAVGKIPNLLWSGRFSKPMEPETLANHIQAKLKRAPLLISAGKKEIQNIAWCTGAAQDYIENAYALGVDAYISGEISERTYYQAKELGLHYFACGHHASERYGIINLGNHLNEAFGLKHQFIDSENPV